MNITELVELATNKNNFLTLENYIEFCQEYLDFAASGLQAVIVSQNEQNYCFFQYLQDGHFNITRPINSHLMYSAENSDMVKEHFLDILLNARDIAETDENNRAIIRNSIYTIQQSIGATLDALPSGKSNTARKINGDLFERLMRLLLQEIGVDCRSGVINVPVIVDGVEQFSMSYQHDLLLFQENELKVIGSVKTSSKDRIDKIFMDKFLYSRLTETATPHIAIFLNDVQRKQTRRENEYGINATFLPGHFRGYTVKLNPLDGVYYCDIRPNMKSDGFLKAHIRTIDCLFCDDLQGFVGQKSL
jgi:hypothetical protein